MRLKICAVRLRTEQRRAPRRAACRMPTSLGLRRACARSIHQRRANAPTARYLHLHALPLAAYEPPFQNQHTICFQTGTAFTPQPLCTPHRFVANAGPALLLLHLHLHSHAQASDVSRQHHPQASHRKHKKRHAGPLKRCHPPFQSQRTIFFQPLCTPHRFVANAGPALLLLHLSLNAHAAEARASDISRQRDPHAGHPKHKKRHAGLNTHPRLIFTPRL